jgi:hypothetical protein
MPRSPRVRCDGCAFEWFGTTSAHGLRIVGACPRCGGVLDFLAPIEEDATTDVTAHVMPTVVDSRTPASVLGTPLRR